MLKVTKPKFATPNIGLGHIIMDGCWSGRNYAIECPDCNKCYEQRQPPKCSRLGHDVAVERGWIARGLCHPHVPSLPLPKVVNHKVLVLDLSGPTTSRVPFRTLGVWQEGCGPQTTLLNLWRAPAAEVTALYPFGIVAPHLGAGGTRAAA